MPLDCADAMVQDAAESREAHLDMVGTPWLAKKMNLSESYSSPQSIAAHLLIYRNPMSGFWAPFLKLKYNQCFNFQGTPPRNQTRINNSRAQQINNLKNSVACSEGVI